MYMLATQRRRLDLHFHDCIHPLVTLGALTRTHIDRRIVNCMTRSYSPGHLHHQCHREVTFLCSVGAYLKSRDVRNADKNDNWLCDSEAVKLLFASTQTKRVPWNGGMFRDTTSQASSVVFISSFMSFMSLQAGSKFKIESARCDQHASK